MDIDQRLIGRYADGGPGPILICISCLHGNEPSGLLGLRRVLETLEQQRPPFRGELIGFIGNLAALNGRRRYLQRDLNRSWHVEAVADLRRVCNCLIEGDEAALPLLSRITRREVQALIQRCDEFVDTPVLPEMFPYRCVPWPLI